ncbi:MAG: IPT/TIG domain-containing protein [Deltaproteobacteria bacterium]|nr:IPT/TIG domain-containing protein [Deltaproteobacteria bacterium]
MPTVLARALRAALPLALLAAVGCVQVTSTTPRDACPGESTVIAGSGFGASQGSGSVSFGSASASVVSWSDTSITANVPAGVAGVVNVVVHTAGGNSGPLPFRAIECPMTGGAGAPRLALGPGGEPHVAVSQAGSLVYLTKGAGAWSAPATVDVLGSGAFEIAVTPDGRPQRRVPAGTGQPGQPAGRSPLPGRQRLVTGGGGVQRQPDLPAVRELQRHPPGLDRRRLARAVQHRRGPLRRELGEPPRLGRCDLGRRGHRRLRVDRLSHPRPPGGRRLRHLAPRRAPQRLRLRLRPDDLPRAPLPARPHRHLATATTDSLGTPAAAASFGRMHFVWREGANLLHRYRDMTAGTLSSQVLVAAGVTGSPTPAVAADPIGDDGAFAVWLDNGQLRGSTFSATTGTWSARCWSPPTPAARRWPRRTAASRTWRGSGPLASCATPRCRDRGAARPARTGAARRSLVGLWRPGSRRWDFRPPPWPRWRPRYRRPRRREPWHPTTRSRATSATTARSRSPPRHAPRWWSCRPSSPPPPSRHRNRRATASRRPRSARRGAWRGPSSRHWRASAGTRCRSCPRRAPATRRSDPRSHPSRAPGNTRPGRPARSPRARSSRRSPRGSPPPSRSSEVADGDVAGVVDRGLGVPRRGSARRAAPAALPNRRRRHGTRCRSSSDCRPCPAATPRAPRPRGSRSGRVTRRRRRRPRAAPPSPMRRRADALP